MFDLVARRDGAINLCVSTSWADRHGSHTVPLDRERVDLLCIYCPTTDACYYIDPTVVRGSNIALRIEAPRNGQLKGVTWARDHREIPSSIRTVRAGAMYALDGTGGVLHSRERRAPWLLRAHSSAG